MKFAIFATLLATAIVAASAYTDDTDDDDADYKAFVMSMARNATIVADFEARLKHLLTLEPDYFDYTPFKSPDFTFDCDAAVAKSAEKPTSVHALRPGDIQVVGAMGDSLSAGCGTNAKTLLGILLEYRGRSWSMGGQSDLERVLTLPNILKKFNPDLHGYNRRFDKSIVLSRGVGFNAAISGQKSNHMPTQARTLVDRLKRSRHIDYKQDWKMVTLFIGGNDLCAVCKKPDFYSPANYVAYIREALDILQAELPRTFVNLVQVVNVTDVKYMNEGLTCTLIHKFECSCGAYPKSEQAEAQLQEYISGYYKLTRELVESGRYDKSDDFTVVLQPFFEDFKPPRLPDTSIDFSYLAPDCFHFSPKGNALAAVGLWNNMLEPVGKKAKTVGVNEKLKCPTKEHPYLFTAKNSN